MKNVHILPKQTGGMLLRISFSVILLFFVEIIMAEADIMTTIILIDSEPILVDIDSEGEILKTYIIVPDYFSSSQSHESLVRRSISRTRGLSVVSQDDTINEIAMEEREIQVKTNTNNHHQRNQALGLNTETTKGVQSSFEINKLPNGEGIEFIPKRLMNKSYIVNENRDRQYPIARLMDASQDERGNKKAFALIFRSRNKGLVKKKRQSRFFHMKYRQSLRKPLFLYHDRLIKAV